MKKFLHWTFRFIGLISLFVLVEGTLFLRGCGGGGGGCTPNTIPNTGVVVGNTCFNRSSCPALNNPQDPMNYGGDKTGRNDNTTAFKNALAQGDLYISQPGTYKVSLGDGSHGIIPPAGRQIQCVGNAFGSPNVTINYTVIGGANDSGVFGFQNGGNTLCGCAITGANGTPPSNIGSNQGNFLVYVSSNTNKVLGNTFSNAMGNSAVQINSDYTGVAASSNALMFNSFSANPYYGISISNVGNNNGLSNNFVQDGNFGIEDDSCSSSSHPTGNSIQDNELTVISGDCYTAGNNGCNSAATLTGGNYPSGCDYSSNFVSNNYIQGKGGIQNAQIGNASPGGTGGAAAMYSGDILGPNATCQTGTSC